MLRSSLEARTAASEFAIAAMTDRGRRNAPSNEGHHGLKASTARPTLQKFMLGGAVLLEQNMANEVQAPTRLIRLPEVKLRTGLARSSIYRMMEDGCFPRPRKLGPRAVAWMVSDIDHWIDSRPSKQVR